MLRERVRQVYVLLVEAIKHCGTTIDKVTVSIEAEGNVISTGKRVTRAAVIWNTIRSSLLKDLIVGAATVVVGWFLQRQFNTSALIGLSAAIIVMITQIAEALYKYEPLRYEAD